MAVPGSREAARQQRAIARLSGLLQTLTLVLVAVPAWAQPPAGNPPRSQDPRLAEAVDSSNAVVLGYANRPITRLRARVLADMPADRARVTISILDQLVGNNIAGPVTSRDVAGVQIIRVAPWVRLIAPNSAT